MDYNGILLRGPGRYNEEVIKFWWQSGSSEMSKTSKKSIIVAACPDHDTCNDPEAFHYQGPTFINAYRPYCTIWG